METLIYGVRAGLALPLVARLWYVLCVVREGFNMCYDRFWCCLSITSPPSLLPFFLLLCNVILHCLRVLSCDLFRTLRQENGWEIGGLFEQLITV